MSQKHAEILTRDGICYISDLGSTNGTFLNGNEVLGDPIEIINGDKIEIGQLLFIYVTENAVKEEENGAED